MSKHVLFVGQMPPAIGGIASILAGLHQHFGESPFVRFLDSGKPARSVLVRAAKSATFLPKFLWNCLRLKGGHVVLFSSAWASYWEKCALVMIARACGAAPHLVMVDGAFPAWFARQNVGQRAVARLCMKFLSSLAAQSLSWRDYYASVFPGVNISIVKGGVDTNTFVPVNRENRNPPTLLFVGWMIKAKGIYDLLDAASALKHGGVQFRLRLVGPAFGKQHKILETIREVGLDGVAIYAGAADGVNALRNEYNEADIFVFPSHFEGFPVALLEAMSSGLACIATRVGGCPDILEEGKAGLLVEHMNPVQLAGTLRRMIEDVDLRKSFARAARERVVREFTNERAFESYCVLVGIDSHSILPKSEEVIAAVN